MDVRLAPERPSISSTTVFLQDACVQHRYIRSRDTSCIVERPERLRAVHVGLAAAVARLEESFATLRNLKADLEAPKGPVALTSAQETDTDQLALALESLNLTNPSSGARGRVPVQFVHSDASVNILDNEAVKFIHGDIEGDVYPENVKRWVADSRAKIDNGESEIPEGLSQGDLYLCPESLLAIQGALGTVCEAVDTVVTRRQDSSPSGNILGNSTTRAFVAIRPPGHHCGENTPSGFCFVNNVAVAAAHAHLRHGMNRVVVLDIDLHHGNGTQSIVWQINEESYRKALEQEAGASPDKPGLQMYYGSVHDILSYPCEDGKPELVQAASVSIHGPHGQHIENVHLRPYSSEQQFWDELYARLYSKLLIKAGEFLDGTGGPGDDVLVFISCGFDANEHEYPSMSRHHRHVPTSFYRRFTNDTRKFADRYARGRLISVLEGGYSDRALTSGAMAHLTGLAEAEGATIDESWWSLENLLELERATKKRRGGRVSQPTAAAPWLARAVEVFASIDSSHLVSPTTSSRNVVSPSSRVLRERKTPSVPGERKSHSQAMKSDVKKIGGRKEPNVAVKQEMGHDHALSDSASESSLSSVPDAPDDGQTSKKLPRVILRLGPRPVDADAP
ncbi:Arginase/deacetylase [Daedalea quercina L-15889]|uniref:Arginase/deacetylase n=1 Tax=Daedalea quercina L-15889 TaxID=1314783 RepID=A0A165MKV2_9APHY|nr:Arginase/deacetylase [Daedalea quercina L-15889]